MKNRINEIKMALGCASAKINDPWINHANKHLDLLEKELEQIEELIEVIPACPLHVQDKRGLTPEFIDWYQFKLPEWWNKLFRVVTKPRGKKDE